MRGALWVGIAGCCWMTAGVTRAAEVDVQGPSECPDATELGFRVERSVGISLAQAPAVRFSVMMERSAGAYAAHLTALGGGSSESKERTLTAADCDQLADAVVVAVALALGGAGAHADEAPVVEAAGSGASSDARVGEAPGAGSGPPAAPPAADSEAPEPTDEQAADAVRPSLSVAVLADVGSLPGPGVGAAFGAELSWKRLQLRALGTLLFEQHTELGNAPAPGADLQLFAGSLLGCTTAVGEDGGFRVPLCLGFELGQLSGVGTGVVSPRSGSTLWAAPRADVGALWCFRQSPICLGATVTGAAPLTRSRFALTEIGTIYRPATVVGRLSLGIGVGFD